MNHPIPACFRTLFVVVMLLTAVTVATQLFHQAALETQIADAAYNLEVLQKRLAKQQLEYDNAVASLPDMEAQFAEAAPLAETAYEQEQALRQQRTALRAENEALATEIARLQAEVEQSGEAMSQVDEAIAHLQDALDTLSLLTPPAQ